MKLSVALALLVAFFCLQTVAVSAQETAASSEKLSLLRELLVVTDAHKNAEAIMESVIYRLEQDRVSLVTRIIENEESLTAGEREDLKKKLISSSDTSRRISEAFRQRVNFSKIVDDVTLEVYDKYYTTEEVRDLIAFYKTPTGKKTIQIMPQIFSDSMTKTSERLMPLVMPIMKEIMDEEMRRTQEMLPRKSRPARRP